MRKIEIKTWKSKVPIVEGEGENRKIVGTEDKDENLLMALNALIGQKDPREMPKGLDNFRLFNRLNKAFTRAEETGELILEESDYIFLKDIIEKDIPSSWGLNKPLYEAIDAFMNAEEVGDKN